MNVIVMFSGSLFYFCFVRSGLKYNVKLSFCENWIITMNLLITHFKCFKILNYYCYNLAPGPLGPANNVGCLLPVWQI